MKISIKSKTGYLLALTGTLMMVACESSPHQTALEPDAPLFTLLSPDETGIEFSNVIPGSHSPFIYINAYSGGGVASGDLDNDGLPDLYFSGNTVQNRLYHNQGNLQFKDITNSANILSEGDWCTGVTMADVNGDGYLDIYVCRAYNVGQPELRRNLLYINNGDLTFTESAKAYGLDNIAYSTQASFFDYDLDGDLDLFVGNHPSYYTTEAAYNLDRSRNIVQEESDKLYRNNGNGTFTDVSVEAGISNYGFLLGVIASDINKDGWIDIYCANDHQEPDYYYINNGDGTFVNGANQGFRHFSRYSKGIDASDFNNDGQVDLCILGMNARDNYRQKTQMSSVDQDMFWQFVKSGYHYQYMRNILQLNNGNGTFSEIGQLANISSTDWSWAALFADFDNDGWKDLFVSNGYGKDIGDKDLLQKIDDIMAQKGENNFEAIMLEVSKLEITQTPLSNYLFRNNRNLTFTDISMESGINKAALSYGSVYCDLDNDGDLDLAINNLQEAAFIYRNNSRQKNGNAYLSIKFVGEGANTFGLGTKLTLKSASGMQYQELTLSRGYASSVEPRLHFGLGQDEMVSSVEVVWPDGRSQELVEVSVDQELVFYQKDATLSTQETKEDLTYFTNILPLSVGLKFKHRETRFDDYKAELLLPHRMSQFGPKLAVGDVDGDGADDFFIGGAAGQAGELFIQQSGTFSKSDWNFDIEAEDIGALFFDADDDYDLDLYVVSGSNEFGKGSDLLKDRLYLNDGRGNFTKSEGMIPDMLFSGSCVETADIDSDGDQDLFVGSRGIPGRYPHASRNRILINDNGKFSDHTDRIAPGLANIGMVSSAQWTDYNNDNLIDLIVVGEWMPITIFENTGNGLIKVNPSGLDNTRGWWNKIVEGDMDADGDIDYICGNFGLNSRFKVSPEEPLHIYAHDFDLSGSLDIVLGYYNQGVCYPVHGKNRSSRQIPNIGERFPSHADFGRATLKDIYGEALDTALHYEANNFASVYLENKGNGDFIVKPLPMQAQFSSVFGIVPADFNGDGHMDILMGGNFYVLEVGTGRNDAGTGVLLLGDGSGNFEAVSPSVSGFHAGHDLRDMALLQTSVGVPIILTANNNFQLQVFAFKGSPEQQAALVAGK